jgi:hypothetical protein
MVFHRTAELPDGQLQEVWHCRLCNVFATEAGPVRQEAS